MYSQSSRITEQGSKVISYILPMNKETTFKDKKSSLSEDEDQDMKGCSLSTVDEGGKVEDRALQNQSSSQILLCDNLAKLKMRAKRGRPKKRGQEKKNLLI